MKLFYIIATLVAAAMVATPLFLQLSGADSYPVGKVVRYDSYSTEIKSLDPATCGDTTSSGIQANIYEGLYTYHFLKRPPEVVPHLAIEMPQVSDDGLTYTIRLKPDVRYARSACFGQAGTRTVKAQDFVLSMKRVADYHINTGLAWAFLSDRIEGLDEFRDKTQKYAKGDFSRYNLPVSGLEAVDELTLRIRLTQPYPQMIYVLAMSVYAPIPQEAVDYYLARDRGMEIRPVQRNPEFREDYQVVGTGPYILKEYTRKKRLILERNPEFGDDPSVTQHRRDVYPSEGRPREVDAQGNEIYPGDEARGLLKDAGKKVPFIDVLHFDFVAEDYSAWNRFLARQTDANGVPRETFSAIIRPDKGLTDSWQKKGIVLHRYTSPAVYWIVFNMEDPVLGKSDSLRQAMCLAFDVETYIKVLMNGRGVRPLNILPNSFKGWKEAGPGAYAKFDLAAAKQKVEQAKKELVAAGVIKPGQDIPEIKFDIPGRDTDSARMGEFIQQQFSKIGIKLKIILSDWPTLQEKVHNKSCQMYTMGWHADYPDAENFLQLYYSGNISKGTNNSNYSRKEFDQLYEKVRIMPDTPERTAMYVQMVQMISEDCPVLLMSEPESFLLTYKWLGNINPHPIGYGYTKFQHLDPEMRKKMGGR